MTTAMEVTARIRRRNPYPADIFPERTADDWRLFHAGLKEHGLSGEGFVGAFSRYVWDQCCDALDKELLEDDGKTEDP